MSRKRNILEEEKLKRTDVLALDIPAVSGSALAKVEQYNQLKKEMQEEILHLKTIIDDLSYLFNIGTVEERKELQGKISKLEWAVYQMSIAANVRVANMKRWGLDAHTSRTAKK